MTPLEKLKQAADKLGNQLYQYRMTPNQISAYLSDFATSEAAREYWLSQSKYKQVRLLTSLLIETADKYVKLQEKKSSEEWVNINDKTPIAYETGVWDGKRSDFVLVECKDEKYHVCKSYEGTMDGFKFLEFCDDRDFQVTNIIRWKYIK